MRVMLADDDKSVSRGFSIILDDAGYEVVGVASDGIEAVEMAKELQPDIIVMDINMPRQDGLSASRQINCDTNRRITPIIIVTAYADRNLVTRAKDCGILGYHVKPVNVDDLLPAIEIGYATASKLNDLDTVVGNLSYELEERKLIERAKGLLMRHLSIGDEEAIGMMEQESKRQKITIKELAAAIIASREEE